MAIENSVSKPRAALDFFKSWESTLLVGGCLTYFAGRAVQAYLGKSAEKYPYLSKMNSKFINYWAFGEVAKVLSCMVVGVKDFSTLFDGRNNEKIREGEWSNRDQKWVHFPNDEFVHNDRFFGLVTQEYHKRCAWVAYRSLATLLKMFSAYALVHGGLKAVGAVKAGPSAMTDALGATAGLGAIGIDLYDLQARKEDYVAHSLHEHIAKDGVGKVPFDYAYTTNLTYAQVAKVLFIGVKTMALFSALSKAELGGLPGRVMDSGFIKKTLSYSSDIFNGFFAALTLVFISQKLHVGADLDKWKEKDSSIFAEFDHGEYGRYLGRSVKHFMTEFVSSREFVRLLEGTATTLQDFGVEVLSNVGVEALGKFAKSFDGYLYVPKVADGIGGLIDKVPKVWTEFNARNAWDATHAAIKLSGDFFAALKYIGAFGGVAYLSDRTKGFGYLKNAFSSASAVMTIGQEYFAPKKEWDEKSKRETFNSVMKISASMGSLFLNGFGGLASAFGKKIPAPAPQDFKPGVYNFMKLNATISVALMKYATDPEN